MRRRDLSELLDKKDPAWPLIQEWARAAKNPVELLPPDREAQDRVLLELQVTTYSTLGAVVYETGGILVDDGWLRILGCGSERLPRSVSDWNFGKTVARQGEPPGYLLVADDAIGGFFAVNGGALGEGFGNVYYLAPDTVEWEALGKGYTDFLRWTFAGDLAKFYEGQRWESWKVDVAGLEGDKAFMFYPFLWAQGPEISKRRRSAIPVRELWDLHLANR
jgi:hypothetical protein